jgi:hypothetical protein
MGALLLASLCLSTASAQTPEKCQAQLQHFTVPGVDESRTLFSPRAFSVRGKPVKLPDRLLFSDKGIEVYANTYPDGRDSFENQIRAGGVGVLMIYQSEAVRQAVIKELRETNALPPPGFGALPDNLKYVEVHFYTDTLLPANLFAEKWHITRINYYQPSACRNVFQNDVHATLGNAYPSSVDEVAYTDEIKAVRLPITNPLWARALQAMLAWTKECIELTDKRGTDLSKP